MTTEEFKRLKEDECKRQNPYKVVDLSQIRMLGKASGETQTSDNQMFSVCGVKTLASQEAGQVLDKLIGLEKKQKKNLSEAYGENNMHGFWNYLATATSMTRETKVALVADARKKILTDAVVLKENPINTEDFFNVAELFMNKNNMEPLSVERDHFGRNGLMLKMRSDAPKVVKLVKGEDFATNDYYLKWSLGTIELGRYYVRLRCENGQIDTSSHSVSRIHAVNDIALKALTAIPQDNNLLEQDFSQFREHALLAMNTKASIAELHYISALLSNAGLREKLIREIAPYEDELKLYQSMGHDLTDKTQHLAMASMTTWELYNNLTQFATHTDLWEKSDHRRSVLQMAATRFLSRKRDIKHYVNIFE